MEWKSKEADIDPHSFYDHEAEVDRLISRSLFLVRKALKV
jgi:hypothetical protein